MSGSRNCPAGLRALIEARSHSLTLNLKIDPVVPGYSPIGLTKLDKNWSYDFFGDGDLLYSGMVGFQPSVMQSTSSMSVGNAESKGLAPAFGIDGITIESIRAGAYNDARYLAFLCDYERPEEGYWILPNGSGIVGRVYIDERSMAFTMELVDLTKLLKQSVVQNWQRQCRAIFGSQPRGTGGGVIEEDFPCGKDTSTMWTGSKPVSSVGAESTRTFTSSTLGAALDTYNPGMLEWLTGDNAGRTEMIESQSGSGVVTLKFPMAFPIQTGDTFKVRADCTNWKDGNNGCKFHFGTPTWKLRYRGEPQTPVSDGDSMVTPGAQVS